MDKAATVSVRGGAVMIDGQQAYWFSATSLRAWNSTREWEISARQAAALSERAPQYDADAAKGKPRRTLVTGAEWDVRANGGQS